MLSTQVQAMSPRPPFPPGIQGMAQSMAAALQHQQQQHQHQHQHQQGVPVSAHQPGGHMPPPFPFSAAAMAHMIAGARGSALAAPRPQPAHQHPAPMLPPGPMPMSSLVPLPSPFQPGMIPGDPRAMGPPLGFPTFVFTQEDLDMVLYGYARGKPGSPGASQGHALSGLRIGELSYGIERILGSPAPVKSNHGPVDPSTLDLPEGLELAQTTFAGTVHYGIFCKKTVISKGSKLGPFRGKQVNTSEIKTNDDNSFMWEIFMDGRLSHFVDGRGNTGNWMAYVNCARYAQEQNLIALQVDGEIWYEACKDIPQGAELLVWYGDQYLQFMGIPVALKDNTDGLHEEELENSEGYKCERCGKVFAYKYYRDKHLKYTRCVDQGDRKFPCHLCTRSFEKRDRLRIHILHVHEKHRPHKCRVCGKSFSQSSSLNKHMRVHSGERPYKCVYCSKAFTASSILRTHIRQHSGEKPFKCKHCGKAFASHAAHDSHVRRTHTKDRACVGCDLCGKSFITPGELKMHMTMQHGPSASSMSPGGFSIQRLASSESDESMGLDMNKDLSSPRTQTYPHPMTGHFGKFHEEAIDVVGMGNDGMHRVAS